MIEDYNPYIEQLLLNEPWRSQPSGGAELLCDGDVDWDGTKHWCCNACGRIGQAPLIQHFPAKRPKNFLILVWEAMVDQYAKSLSL